MVGERYNAAIAESEESLYGSDPERPVGAADDGSYRYIGKRAGTWPGLNVPGEDANEALGSTRPHRTVRAFPQQRDVVGGEAVGGCHGEKLAVLPRRRGRPEFRKTAVGSDPQRAVPAHRKRLNIVGGQSGRVAVVVGGEFNAVEASESLFRPQPKIAVGRLGNGVDRVLG